MNNQYRLELRFGDDILQEGFTAVPNILRNHYTDLGMNDGQFCLVVHLLTHQWTKEPAFPRLRNLPMSVTLDTRREYLRGMRNAGLMFTHRLYKNGHLDRQEYHLDSLWWNLRRLVKFKETWRRPKPRMRAIDDGFEIALPEWVWARICRKFYHDVPSIWQERAAEHAREIIAAQKRGEPISKAQRWAVVGSTIQEEEQAQAEELEELVTLGTIPVYV